jgi:uncharacterized membrane protein
MERNTRQTITAVNFGGCIVPVGISVYEIAYLAQFDPHTLALGRWVSRERRGLIFCR